MAQGCGYVSDEALAVVAPIAAFWVAVVTYELVACLRPDTRLHSKEEEETANIPSRRSVIGSVLFQQAVQCLLVLLFLHVTGNGGGIPDPQPGLPVLAPQLVAATAILDTVQYFGHRCLHASKFLYNNVHSTHHGLVVPYGVGGLYSHPMDGVLLDVVGGLLAAGLAGMTARTSAYFFSLASVRTVEIHCGLWLPWSPSQLLFGNNPAFHDSHHQLKGFRCNFSQPFFVAWDKLLGTYVPFEVVRRDGGGYEVKLMKGE